MTRFVDELAAAVFDVIAPQYALLVLLGVAALSAVLWYSYPAWVPHRFPRLRRLTLPRLRLPRLRRPRLRLPRLRWPRLRWPRVRWPRLRWPTWRRRARRGRRAAPAAAPGPRIEATAPLTGGMSAADRFAAQGRFAEAIRERLREIVGGLVAAGVVAPQPGWTAAELSVVAATARPAVAGPLHDATALFSEVWYAQRPALAAHDDRMRALVAEVRNHLEYAVSSR